MKIGILQTGITVPEIAENFGQFDDMFAALLDGHGFTFETYMVIENQFPAGVDACDGWLITGSKHGAYEDHIWIPPLEDFIRDSFAAHVPMIGVCFGHQIIAQAMGGTVEKFDGGWAVGRQTYDVEGEGEMSIMAWHQDQVTRLPDAAKVVGKSGFCENAVLVYDDRIFTTQPHPEFEPQIVSDLITYRGQGNVPNDLLAGAAARNDIEIQNKKMAAMFASFYKTKHAQREA